ncbi:MAG TPA: MobF family relaxase [Bryobacteraceae bacterium]|jgi:conjugative relaxase-like TrwC/TraI family protein
MLRIIQNTSSARAKQYYSTADYYSEGQELDGVWRGVGAARLGLTGRIDRDAWDALCDGRDPTTGASLTLRRNQERRVGYDFNFHVPKSVSLLYGITNDDRIQEAFRASVDETMREMEAEMKARDRKAGRNGDKVTGNMVWGEFIHRTARPVDGVPDPHLHAHCFVFNATFCHLEHRWKAGQFGDLKKDATYFEARFHSRMARRMAELGLPVERTRAGWEIAGLSSSTLAKFSRRTALIEKEAADKGITDAKEKERLGAKTREHKQKHLTMDELRELWKARLADPEMTGLHRICGLLGGKAIAEDQPTAARAVDAAVEHWFERKSVVPERRLLATALRQSVGHASILSVEREAQRRGFITADRNGSRFVTTREVLDEERFVIGFARQGRGTCRAFDGTGYVVRRDWLNADQRRAVQHVLSSKDRVVLIRGAAGVGKTAMMQEAVEGIEAAGTRVFTFAPSATASHGVLRHEGFADADTLARLLIDPAIHEKVRGQVLWVDEAGLVGAHDMARLFELADRLDARVILSGDRHQHGSVARGAALRLLETEAGLTPAEIRDIQRQKGTYKDIVRALSEGRTADGFHRLDELGWVRELPDGDRYQALAADYVATLAEGRSALAVSPTHHEGELICAEIRAELRGAGRLGTGERQFSTLEKTNWTVGERRDPLNYRPGDMIEFTQNARGFKKGERIVVDGTSPLPLEQADRFQVFRQGSIPVSVGDLIRITQNGRTADGTHRLNNGSIYAVKGFTAAGDLALANGWAVSKDFGHLKHGYVVTSHASQGRTVDRVFIGQSSDSYSASSRQQFYVSISRAREWAMVYTDDRAALLEAVDRADDRMTATEMVTLRGRRERHAAMERAAQEQTAAHRTPPEPVRHEELSHGR